MYIGITSNFRHKCNIKWTNNDVKCIGVYKKKLNIATDHNINKNPKYNQSWELQAPHSKRQSHDSKLLLHTQMLYIASVLYISQWAISKFKTLITNFLWCNKPAKIKYTTMTVPISQGGLQLQDLQTKIEANKISWIKVINKDKYHPYSPNK